MPALGVVAAMLSTEKVLAVIGSRVFVQGIIGIVLIILCYRNKFTFYHKEYWNEERDYIKVERIFLQEFAPLL